MCFELAYSKVEEWDWMARALWFSGRQSDQSPRIEEWEMRRMRKGVGERKQGVSHKLKG